MKVFITGGNGYLGRNLIKYLLNEAGCTEVVGIARSEAAAAEIVKAGGRAVKGVDLTDVEKMRQAAEGCDYAVHCAALVTFWARDYSESRRVNVQGTLNVINACKQAGVKKVIVISTESIYQQAKPRKGLDDSTPLPKRNYGPYATSKREAEIAALAASDSTTEVVAIRPCMVWGRDDTHILPELGKAARSKDLKWFNGGKFNITTVHVLNCCHGIWCAIQKGKGGQAYLLTDGESVEMRGFFISMLDAAGVPEINQVTSVSRSLLWGVSAILETIAVVTRKPPLITRAVLAGIAYESTLVDTKARNELGYTNKISIAEGLQELRSQYADKGKSVLDPPSASG